VFVDFYEFLLQSHAVKFHEFSRVFTASFHDFFTIFHMVADPCDAKVVNYGVSLC
jgi:hypothetical protein